MPTPHRAPKTAVCRRQVAAAAIVEAVLPKRRQCDLIARRAAVAAMALANTATEWRCAVGIGVEALGSAAVDSWGVVVPPALPPLLPFRSLPG